MSRWLIGSAALSALVTIAGAPAPAAAYRLPARFGAPVDSGGGAGRYFTGSPRDGQNCLVCHLDAPAPEMTLEGFPNPRAYAPDQEYVLDLRLAGGTVFGANLELVGENGQAIGDAQLLGPNELEADERCANGDPAAEVVDLEDGRRVISMNVCGASRVRLRWVAPSAGSGPVQIFASGVGGDDSGDPTGDGSAALTRVLAQEGNQAAFLNDVGGGCRSRNGTPWALWLLVGTLVLLRRRFAQA